jgi:hypothetical protein
MVSSALAVARKFGLPSTVAAVSWIRDVVEPT